MSVGSPSNDARCMLQGLRNYLQEQYPSRTMLENCSKEGVNMDPSAGKVIWISSVTTGVVVSTVHLTRWFLSSHEHLVSELLICVLALVGVALFLYDVHACKLHTGMAKLLVLLLLANGLIPLLRYDPDPDEPIDEDIM